MRLAEARVDGHLLATTMHSVRAKEIANIESFLLQSSEMANHPSSLLFDSLLNRSSSKKLSLTGDM